MFYNKNKGFISIILALAVVVVSAVALYEYNQVKQVDEVLGGSSVSQKYGGTGANTSAWSGLLRLTAGTWATTTIIDSDVPDDITITNIPNELDFATITTNYLYATTSELDNLTVTGTTTFSVIPTLPDSDPTTDNQAVRKSYVDEIDPEIDVVISFTDTLRNSNDTSRTTDSLTYVKVKEVKITGNGLLTRVRAKFFLKPATSDVQSVSARIYKNGVAIGTERSNNTSSGVTYSEDLEVEFNDNDLIQIYAKRNQTSLAEVTHFRLYFDWQLLSIGGMELTTPLKFSTTPVFTNQDPE